MQYQLTVELPEYCIAQLKVIPDATRFLSKAVREAIDRESVTTKTGSQSSDGKNGTYLPFLDEDFFDDDTVPSDLAVNHDKYLYE